MFGFPAPRHDTRAALYGAGENLSSVSEYAGSCTTALYVPTPLKSTGAIDRIARGFVLSRRHAAARRSGFACRTLTVTVLPSSGSLLINNKTGIPVALS